MERLSKFTGWLTTSHRRRGNAFSNRALRDDPFKENAGSVSIQPLYERESIYAANSGGPQLQPAPLNRVVIYEEMRDSLSPLTTGPTPRKDEYARRRSDYEVGKSDGVVTGRLPAAREANRSSEKQPQPAVGASGDNEDGASGEDHVPIVGLSVAKDGTRNLTVIVRYTLEIVAKVSLNRHLTYATQYQLGLQVLLPVVTAMLTMIDAHVLEQSIAVALLGAVVIYANCLIGDDLNIDDYAKRLHARKSCVHAIGRYAFPFKQIVQVLVGSYSGLLITYTAYCVFTSRILNVITFRSREMDLETTSAYQVNLVILVAMGTLHLLCSIFHWAATMGSFISCEAMWAVPVRVTASKAGDPSEGTNFVCHRIDRSLKRAWSLFCSFVLIVPKSEKLRGWIADVNNARDELEGVLQSAIVASRTQEMNDGCVSLHSLVSSLPSSPFWTSIQSFMHGELLCALSDGSNEVSKRAMSELRELDGVRSMYTLLSHTYLVCMQSSSAALRPFLRPGFGDAQTRGGEHIRVGLCPFEATEIKTGTPAEFRAEMCRANLATLALPLHDHQQSPEKLSHIAFATDSVTLSIMAAGSVRLCNIHTYKVISSPVDFVMESCYAFSPDGQSLAIGLSTGTVDLWNMATGQCIQSPDEHNGAVKSVTLTAPDGRTVASGGEDGVVRLWDVATGESRSLSGHKSAVMSVAFSCDGKTVASGGEDTILTLWDVAAGIKCRTFRGHTDTVISVAFQSPVSTMVASAGGGKDRTVRLWNVEKGKLCTIIIADTSNDLLKSVAFSPDGQTVTSVTAGGRVRLWDVNTGKSRTLSGHPDTKITCVAFSPDGQTVAGVFGQDSKTVRLWDLATSVESGTFFRHTDSVIRIAYSPDGKTVATISADDTVWLWDVPLDGSSSSRYDTVPLGGWDATEQSVGKDCLRVLNQIRSFDASRLWGVSCVAYSPDGTRVASGSQDENVVRLWDLSTGKSEILSAHTGKVTSVAFSPNGRIIASGSEDNTVRLWGTAFATAGAPRTLLGHSKPVTCVAFSVADEHLIVSGSLDKTVRLWDVSSCESVHILNGHTGFVSSVAFSPDGKTVASGSWDKTVRLWDVLNPKSRTLKGHTDCVNSVAFSPDGTTLASGGGDKTVRLWKVETVGECRTLSGHTDKVTSVAFSPDGKTVASGGEDKTVRLWDVATAGARPRSLSGLSSHVKSVGETQTAASGTADTRPLYDETAAGARSRSMSETTNHVNSVGERQTAASGTAAIKKRLSHYEEATGKPGTFSGFSNGVKSVAFSPDGKTVACGSFREALRLWDVDTGACKFVQESTYAGRLAPWGLNSKWRLDLSEILASEECSATFKNAIEAFGRQDSICKTLYETLKHSRLILSVCDHLKEKFAAKRPRGLSKNTEIFIGENAFRAAVAQFESIVWAWIEQVDVRGALRLDEITVAAEIAHSSSDISFSIPNKRKDRASVGMWNAIGSMSPGREKKSKSSELAFTVTIPLQRPDLATVVDRIIKSGWVSPNGLKPSAAFDATLYRVYVQLVLDMHRAKVDAKITWQTMVDKYVRPNILAFVPFRFDDNSAGIDAADVTASMLQ